MPLSSVWLGDYSASDVLQKILFVAGWAGGTSNQLTRNNVKIEHESEGAVSDVFELTSFHFTGQDRQIRVLAFQRLHARHFIGTFNALTLFG